MRAVSAWVICTCASIISMMSPAPTLYRSVARRRFSPDASCSFRRASKRSDASPTQRGRARGADGLLGGKALEDEVAQFRTVLFGFADPSCDRAENDLRSKRVHQFEIARPVDPHPVQQRDPRPAQVVLGGGEIGAGGVDVRLGPGHVDPRAGARLAGCP